MDDFSPVIYDLLDLMENWPLVGPWADFDRFWIGGFSQGAALAYAFALRHPERVQAVAGLAGFLPLEADSFFQDTAITDLTVYVSHGQTDKLVSVAKAREAVQKFNQAGAKVTYCESDVGHKLSADCFKGLESFFVRS